jgi:hypothetical protein
MEQAVVKVIRRSRRGLPTTIGIAVAVGAACFTVGLLLARALAL